MCCGQHHGSDAVPEEFGQSAHESLAFSLADRYDAAVLEQDISLTDLLDRIRRNKKARVTSEEPIPTELFFKLPYRAAVFSYLAVNTHADVVAAYFAVADL